MRSPEIKSKKQYIRIWFEFYKLSLLDPDLKDNIKKSSKFYKQWGDVSNLKFDEWWKTSKPLFGETRVKESTRIIRNKHVLNVSIPLNLPITNSLKEVKKLIEDKQQDLMGDGHDQPKKSKIVGGGKYELTQGVEVRGRTLNEILVVYQKFIHSGKPPINMEFVMKVHRELQNRPRSKWTLYFLGDVENSLDHSNLVRYMRRMVQRGSKICTSVSKGDFPGKSTLS